jgi:hypothetical protein
MGERATAIRKQSGLAEKIILPEDRDRLGCVTQIRVRATCQRDEFSLCTSKFESDHPSHEVGLFGRISDMGGPRRTAPVAVSTIANNRTRTPPAVASSKVATAKSISASAIRNMIARRDEICPRLAGGFSYTWTLAGAIGTNPRPFLCGLRFVQLVAPCSVAVGSGGAGCYPIY